MCPFFTTTVFTTAHSSFSRSRCGGLRIAHYTNAPLFRQPKENRELLKLRSDSLSLFFAQQLFSMHLFTAAMLSWRNHSVFTAGWEVLGDSRETTRKCRPLLDWVGAQWLRPELATTSVYVAGIVHYQQQQHERTDSLARCRGRLETAVCVRSVRSQPREDPSGNFFLYRWETVSQTRRESWIEQEKRVWNGGA